ncbi:hypothetical protein MB02_14155 [Croceicoccus estronivorus]|uniref:sulfotransferase family 2 domain-containing protein n=1 Tax=Croceicoccus estronivorus TaxID=1172626 RepID=UPI000831A96B|nr:sulfotransferase family 2 domain-containing protein [Croceicoccus estronivorus]OCC22908.1 hypothetical protein MB02_14155 [Croceicoccus estronivorus]
MNQSDINAKAIAASTGFARRALPRSWRMWLLAQRRAHLWKRAGLIFIHVPKNGGTSINRAIYGRFMGHFTVDDVARARPGLYASLPSLALTRNPWARTFSAYRFARSGNDMADGAAIAVPERYRTASFASFERFVVEWLDGRDLSREDPVFRPQCAFILRSGGNIGVTHLGRLEEPASYAGFLETTLGHRPFIEHLNRTSAAPDYRDAYTPEMRDIVARAYARDIERFHYDF